MGIYLNPSNENFRRIVSSEIYVDKTMMLSVLNDIIGKQNNYVCISRPRRFGKTITSNMLSAYYSKGCDSEKLFFPYKIASAKGFKDKLNKFNVIKIDVNSEFQNTINKQDLIPSITNDIRKEFTTQFPEVVFTEQDSIGKCILKVFAATSEQFVIILDEYDVLVRENVEQELFKQYLDFLNGIFKSDTLRPAIALAYLTGIFPIVRDKVQSKLNNFEEYTILNSSVLSEFVGFTTKEVMALSKKYGVDFKECKRWYDGYHLAWYDKDEYKTCEIYNPESVVKSMLHKKIGNYWNKTSSYEVISERIQQNFEGTKDAVIKMLSGESVDVDVGMFLNTMTQFRSKNDVFAYLIHLGYLAYNEALEECRIPNCEVQQEWFRAISVVDEYAETDKIIKASKELLAETLRGNESAVASSLDLSHIHVTSNRSYNNEDALQSAIYLSFIYALNKYTVIKEMTTGKGFADVVFIPFAQDFPALIIELKRNGTADTALTQIREKQYFDSLSHYSGNLLFVGINYDEATKKHDCKIERFVKK